MNTILRIATLACVTITLNASGAADHSYSINGGKAAAFDIYNDGRNTYVEAVKGLVIEGARKDGESLVVSGIPGEIAGRHNGKKVVIRYTGKRQDAVEDVEVDKPVSDLADAPRAAIATKPASVEAQLTLARLEAKMEAVIREQVAAQVALSARAKEANQTPVPATASAAEVPQQAIEKSGDVRPKAEMVDSNTAQEAIAPQVQPRQPNASEAPVSSAEAIRARDIALFEEPAGKAAQPSVNVIRKGRLINEGLEERAKAEGWTFLWYSKRRWEAIADIDMSHYTTADEAVDDIVTGLREEGKPIYLRISEGNKVMEIFSTEVKND